MTDDKSQIDSKREQGGIDRPVSRRGAIAAGLAIGTGGCLGFFENSPTGRDGSSAEAEEYTTVPGTTTFARVTGDRTPYPSVQPVKIDEGRLMSVYFDYAQQASVEWWVETFPRIEELVTGEEIRLSFGMFPVPESRWSVMLPCALIAVKSEAGNDSAVEFHQRVIKEGPEYTMSIITDAAEAVGADPVIIERAARERIRRNQVFASKEFAVDNGIDLPPGVLGVDEPLPDASAETIRSAYTTETEG